MTTIGNRVRILTATTPGEDSGTIVDHAGNDLLILCDNGRYTLVRAFAVAGLVHETE